MQNTPMGIIRGTLIYDINKCHSEDLARAEASLILAGARYRVESAVDVHCEQGIAFDFKRDVVRNPSGQYSLAGLAEITAHCRKFPRKAA